MYNKPELEIFADDVACGHGATCGGLDARTSCSTCGLAGSPRRMAESLLLEAFAGGVGRRDRPPERCPAGFRAEIDALAGRGGRRGGEGRRELGQARAVGFSCCGGDAWPGLNWGRPEGDFHLGV